MPLFYLFLSLLAWLALQDYRYRLLSNKLLGGLTLLSALLSTQAIATGQLESGWWLLSQPLSVLVIGLGLFVFGICGAGDVKLLAALSLAISPNYWLVTLLLIALFGGLLALVCLLYSWYYNKLDELKERGLPYGIAIASAGALGISASLFIKL